MNNRNPSNVELLKEYIKAINFRFLREEDLPAYDSENKIWNEGQFYLHESIGRNGYVYEVREVEDEGGKFKVHSPAGLKSDELVAFVDGWMKGHFLTLDMLEIKMTVRDKESNDIIYEDNIGEVVELVDEAEGDESEQEEGADDESAPEEEKKA